MRFADCVPGIAAAGLAALLAGCSGGSSALTTGSLFGSGQATQATAAPQPAPVTATDRAVHMGAVTARATQCGYHYDPARLKGAYLAYEAQQGAAPEALHKIEREYEFTRLTMRNAVAKDPDYCSDARTREIKAALTRHLAGDFSPPVKSVAAKDPGFFGSLSEVGDTREVMNPEYMRDKTAPKTKRISTD